MAIAVGSVERRGAASSRPSGMRQQPRRGDDTCSGRTRRGSRGGRAARAGGTPTGRPRATGAALAAARGRVGDDRGRRSPSRRRRRRPRRSCPPTRGRAPSRGGRTARARGAGRCRRSRSARPRSARRRRPRLGHRELADLDRAVTDVDRRGHGVREHAGNLIPHPGPHPGGAVRTNRGRTRGAALWQPRRPGGRARPTRWGDEA